MKRIFVTVLVLIAATAAGRSNLFSENLKPNPTIKLAAEQSPTDQDSKVLGLRNKIEITQDGKVISISWVKIENINNLKLISNLKDKLTPNEAKEKYNCKTLVNGGFYTTTFKPIGLFITDYKQQEGYKKSTLTNAVLSVNDFATPRITATTPKDRLRLAVQNGPLLVENNEIKKLKLIKDEDARRIVAATTGKNELYFLSFSDSGSSFMGPKLVNLPELISSFESQTNIDIADALNLDGGNASVFISQDTNLSSSTMVGSFFCEE